MDSDDFTKRHCKSSERIIISQILLVRKGQLRKVLDAFYILRLYPSPAFFSVKRDIVINSPYSFDQPLILKLLHLLSGHAFTRLVPIQHTEPSSDILFMPLYSPARIAFRVYGHLPAPRKSDRLKIILIICFYWSSPGPYSDRLHLLTFCCQLLSYRQVQRAFSSLLLLTGTTVFISRIECFDVYIEKFPGYHFFNRLEPDLLIYRSSLC